MLKFSTAAVPQRQRFEAWRHAVTRKFLPLRPEPVRDARFRGEVRGAAIDSLMFAQVFASGQIVHRGGGEMAQASPDALFVNLHAAGSSAFECDTNARRLSPGDLFFVDGRRPFRLHCERPMHHVVIAIPMDRLRAGLHRPELAAGTVVSRPGGVTALLADYLFGLAREHELLGPTSTASAARHLIELVACALNERHAGFPPAREALRGALHARARQIIDQELGDPLLSPPRIARRLRTSVRFVHALFRERGQSLMRVVYEKRVRRAAELLVDVATAHRSITDIALSCGFSDLTHFGRVFAKVHAQTPRQFRARAS